MLLFVYRLLIIVSVYRKLSQRKFLRVGVVIGRERERGCKKLLVKEKAKPAQRHYGKGVSYLSKDTFSLHGWRSIYIYICISLKPGKSARQRNVYLGPKQSLRHKVNRGNRVT